MTIPTRTVDTGIGKFKIGAIANAQGQKIWQVVDVPAAFKDTMEAMGITLREMVLNAVAGDESGRNAINILKSMLPISGVKERQLSPIIPHANVNWVHFASKKRVAETGRPKVTNIHTGRGLILRKKKKS